MLANPSNYVQSGFANISATTTTTSASFATILTVSLTTPANSKLYCISTVCPDASVAATAITIGIFVDGVQQVTSAGAGATATATVSFLLSAECVVAVGEGAHTITLQWKTAGGTATLNPTANAEHAALLVLQSYA